MSADLSRRLTRRHAARQAAVRAAVASQAARIFKATFDIDDVAGSWGLFAAQVTPLIQQQHGVSSELAAQYFTRFRQASRAAGSSEALLASTPRPDQIRRLLEYDARIATLRTIANGMPADRAAQSALTRVVGTCQSLVSDGGRETVMQSTDADDQASGWVRLPEDDACDFCALLATRGPAYRSETSATFEAHRFCQCEAEPVYGQWQRTDQQQEWLDLYREVTRDTRGGEESRAAWRAAYRDRYGTT